MPTPARPGQNHLKCNGCGRTFNTPEELSSHEARCGAAQSSTRDAGKAAEERPVPSQAEGEDF